jgi:hypothetical protein
MHGTRKAEKAPTGKHPASYFVEQITALWNKQVETILETGRLLIQAKQELPHGEFGVMIAKQLPFGSRAAQQLMAVARNPVLSNATYVSHLPPSWGTLYDLAGMPESELLNLIKTEQIHPGMERADVKKFHFARFDQVPSALRVLLDFMYRVPPGELAMNVMFNSWSNDMFADAARKLPCYVEELLEAVEKYRTGRDKEIDEYCDKVRSQSRTGSVLP